MLEYVNDAFQAYMQASKNFQSAFQQMLKSVQKAHKANYSAKSVKALKESVEASNKAEQARNEAQKNYDLQIKRQDSEMMPKKPVKEMSKLELLECMFKIGFTEWLLSNDSNPKVARFVQQLNRRFDTVFPYFYTSGNTILNDKQDALFIVTWRCDEEHFDAAVEDIEAALKLILPVHAGLFGINATEMVKCIGILPPYEGFEVPRLLWFGEHDVRVYVGTKLARQCENVSEALKYILMNIYVEKNSPQKRRKR